MTFCCFELNANEDKKSKKDVLRVSFILNKYDEDDHQNNLCDIYEDDLQTIFSTSFKEMLKILVEDNTDLYSNVLFHKSVKYVNEVKKSLLDCVAYLDKEITKSKVIGE